MSQDDTTTPPPPPPLDDVTTARPLDPDLLGGDIETTTLFNPRGRIKAMFSRRNVADMVFVVAILAAAGSVFRHHLAWGDVPTWVLAATTLAAFVAAVYGGMVAYNLLRVENQRDQKAALERQQARSDRGEADRVKAAQLEADKRAQASKVTAWFAYWSARENRRVTSNGSWGAVVANASDLPVFDVEVPYFWVIDNPGGSWSGEQRDYSPPERFRVLPPGDRRFQAIPPDVQHREVTCDDNVYVVGIEFTDANGNRWRRTEHADLILLSP